MKTKRILAIFISVCLGFCLILTGCGQQQNSASQENTQNTPESTSTAKSGANQTGYPVFDFNEKTVTLNSGHAMPILGLPAHRHGTSPQAWVQHTLHRGVKVVHIAMKYGSDHGGIPFCKLGFIGVFTPEGHIAPNGHIAPSGHIAREAHIARRQAKSAFL